MKKAVFFDLDNTLWTEVTGRMPESTKEAMRRLRENGVYTFLCSGRTRCFILSKKILDLGFDGFVSGCGTYVDFRDEIIFYHAIPQEVVRKTIDILREHRIPVLLEGRYHLYVTESAFKAAGLLEILKRNMKGLLEDIESHAMHWEVSKFSAPMFENIFEGAVKKELEPWYDFQIYGAKHLPFQPVIVEAVPIGFTKATGMQKACEALGIARENTYAFGDSVNDMEMIRYAGHGIVMGDGDAVVKAVAEYITDPVLHNGVLHALEHFELI